MQSTSTHFVVPTRVDGSSNGDREAIYHGQPMGMDDIHLPSKLAVLQANNGEGCDRLCGKALT